MALPIVREAFNNCESSNGAIDFPIDPAHHGPVNVARDKGLFLGDFESCPPLPKPSPKSMPKIINSHVFQIHLFPFIFQAVVFIVCEG